MQREIRTALDFIAAHPQQLQALAEQRAKTLLADHQRVLAAIDKETRGGCLWLATADQAG